MSENSKEANNTLKALIKTLQHNSVVIENSSGNILPIILNHWTEYCSDLYNYELHPGASLIQSDQPPTPEAER